MLNTYAPAQRLLDLPDAHGVLLAEFDFFPEHQALYVRWHGHLTATTVIQGTLAGQALRHDGAAPRRLLSDKSQTSGDWSEALPWILYEWLPQAAASGLKATSYVLSPDPATQASSQEFIKSMRQVMPLGVFHNAGAAWQWLLRRG